MKFTRVKLGVFVADTLCKEEKKDLGPILFYGYVGNAHNSLLTKEEKRKKERKKEKGGKKEEKTVH